MSQEKTVKNRKFLKTGLLAVASLGLYGALFANESSVTEFYTKGGAYAALPVLTAFAFSIVHGSFASQCFDMLGITASKSTLKQVEITKQKQTEKREDHRPRLHAN